MVVHGHTEHTLGVILADYVIVQHAADFLRRRHPVARLHQVRLVLLTDDIHAQLDALVADEHGRARDQLAHLMLRLAAERAVQGVFRVAGLAHARSCPRAARQALVVVVHRDRQHPLGVILADDVIVQHLADFLRGRHPVAGLHQMRFVLLTDDIHAQFDTLVADEDRRTGDELTDLVLRLAAERAVEGIFRIAGLAHAYSSPKQGHNGE